MFKRDIDLTIVLAVAAQTVALIWFAASLRNDIDANKVEIARNNAKIESLELIVQNQAVTMARMDENIKAIRDAVESIIQERRTSGNK